VKLLDLPEPLNLRARVVRLIETARYQDLSPEIGIVFVDLSKEVRERIIRFALEVQRDRRRRGMM
jgi:c-di-GMP-binding flagellar brake protein YcgR